MLLFGACLVAALLLGPFPARAQEPAVGGRVVFARAADIADSAAAAALVRNCRQAGFNVLVLQVKEPDGTIYFSSRRFLAARAKTVVKFDPLKAVLDAAAGEKLTVHAGLCAFLEGPASPPVNDHPEWAALTPKGKTTADLEDSPGVWMCPARRPGYTEGYLIPMIEELLASYAVDGIHFDHLCFPGELGPDSYCFCDYCVQEFPVRSRLFYPALPGERFEWPRSTSDPVAGWSRGPTILPSEYDSLMRKLKGEYMLRGASAKRGPSDMDYFFYTYRTDAIRDFCARVYESARAASPKVQFSARVYWNAPAAGRFAGQRWTDFGQWFDFLVLDLGRGYLPGDFPTYRKLLADVAFYMARSSRNLVYAYAGLNLDNIYREERKSLQSMLEILTDLAANPGKDPRLHATRLAAAFENIKTSLAQADETLADDLRESIGSLVADVQKSAKPGEIYTRIGVKVQRLIDKPPAGLYSPGKLREIIGDLRGAGADSVALDGAASILRLKLSESLPGILGPAGREPFLVRPLKTPSTQVVRLFLEKQEQLANASAEIELLNRRLEKVNSQLEPLRVRMEGFELTEKEKVEKLDGLILELDTLREEYSSKIAELEQMSELGGKIPAVPLERPGLQTPDLELPAQDLDYTKLRRMLEEKIEELKIAIGQRERAEEIAIRLSMEIEKAHADLTQQKQEYLYYVSILIALACVGLAVVLVVSLIRHRR